MPKYLSASETAVILGVSHRRVNQLKESGILSGVRIGNSNAIDPESLRQYLKRVRKYTKKPKQSNGHR